MRIVGIDVSKDKIDAAIVAASAHRSFANSAQDQQQMLTWLDEHDVDKAVMEATGGYERPWAKLLQGRGIAVQIVDPRRVPMNVLDLRAQWTRGPVELRLLVANALNYVYNLVPQTLAPVRTTTLTAVWSH